jgi:hypothetical protein
MLIYVVHITFIVKLILMKHKRTHRCLYYSHIISIYNQYITTIKFKFYMISNFKFTQDLFN